MVFKLESTNFFCRQMAEILPLRRRTLLIQSITKRFANIIFGSWTKFNLFMLSVWAKRNDIAFTNFLKLYGYK